MGYGKDTVFSYFDDNPNKRNLIVLGNQIGTGNVQLRRGTGEFANALEIGVAGAEDVIRVQEFFIDGDPYNPHNPVQGIEFLYGEIWDIPTIVSQLVNE